MAIARWFTVIWFVSTLIGLGLPGAALPDTPTDHFDKVAHLAIFTVGTALALLGWPEHRARVLLLMLLFAPLSEVWQAVLPTGRQADVLDVVANAVGIGVGWGLARLAWRTPRVAEV
jgi:VanZ family protein